MGRTVGRICSVTGTSLTVNVSRVVTFWFSAPAAVEDVELGAAGIAVVVVVGAGGGGVEDCAFRPEQRAPAKRRTAGPLRASFWFFRYIMFVVLVFAVESVKHPPCHAPFTVIALRDFGRDSCHYWAPDCKSGGMRSNRANLSTGINCGMILSWKRSSTCCCSLWRVIRPALSPSPALPETMLK